MTCGGNASKPVYPNITIAVFYVDTVSEPLEFHWAFFVQYPDRDHGLKVHATDISDQWEYDTWPFTLSASESVAAAVIIGQVPPGRTMGDFETILKKVPMNVIPAEDVDREDSFDCKVWLRGGVRQLCREGWIACKDVYALEDEVQLYGEAACKEMNQGTFTSFSIYSSRFSF